ncbi:restriction endonuclease [Endozoicomonas acroporae]|uniref:restriction endonuclease n=1 Tax=Endozoicomonas acroporae TaxID=1701104 RepID=UPI003D7BC307
MTQLTINNLQEMDWKRFEELCQKYFQYKGYDSKLTGSGADGGVDVVLKRSTSEGESITIYVQCKAWSNQRVGVKPVRELYGVMASDEVPIGIFITASDFTDDAKVFARGKKFQLISGERLLSLINQLPDDQQTKLASAALEGDFKTPTCPKCDTKMVLRTTAKGKHVGDQFWGCRNFPSCRQNLHVKGGRSKPEENEDFYESIFNVSRKRSGQSTGAAIGSQSSGANSQTQSSYTYRSSLVSAEGWAAESRDGRSSRKKSKKSSSGKSNGKVLLVSVVLSIGLVAGFVKAMDSVFDWFGDSMIQHAGKVQNDVQQSSKQSVSKQPKTNTVSPAPATVMDAYDQQVLALERQASLEYERQLAADRQRKLESWEKWYKPLWGCDDFRSDEHMVDCVNHKRRAKEEFDILWADGRLK